MQLSDKELEEIIRIKKTGGKRAEALRKKREKAAAQLAAIDAQIAQLTGGEAPAAPKAKGRPGPRAGAKRGKINFVAKMREVFAQAGKPLRAREIVESLPEVGVKIKDIPYTRKRVSVALATNKCFEQVSRGIYQLRDADE